MRSQSLVLLVALPSTIFFSSAGAFRSTVAFSTRIHRPLVGQALQASSTALHSRRRYSPSTPVNMPRGVKKENLPSKICVTCNRPFTWRKKWERVWDEVTTCSKSCNNKRRQKARQTQQSSKALLDDGSQKKEIETKQASVMFDQEHNGAEDLPDLLQALEMENAFQDSDSNSRTDNSDDRHIHQEEVTQNQASAFIQNSDSDNSVDPEATNKEKLKAARKAAKKAKKAERRAQRQGKGDPDAGKKSCDLCDKKVNLLIRCMHEQGQVDWSMVCGKCWNDVSGGVPDGDTNHPHYRYGGLWKNRRAQEQK